MIKQHFIRGLKLNVKWSDSLKADLIRYDGTITEKAITVSHISHSSSATQMPQNLLNALIYVCEERLEINRIISETERAAYLREPCVSMQLVYRASPAAWLTVRAAALHVKCQGLSDQPALYFTPTQVSTN